jgi:predicted membrane protein
MKIKTITLLENTMGLILAIFIVFQLLPNIEVCRKMNQPVYILLYLVFTVILFVTLNPIVGFLFLVYGYQLISRGKQESKRNETLKQLNPKKEADLEEIVIQNSDFARIKNQDEDQVTRVKPVLEKIVI